MLHGLLDSSDCWISNGWKKGPAYIALREGYDVWLGNSRGNKYSRRHVSLKPSHKEFWNYSWEELGLYDIPAFTDYILEITGHPKLAFIGHSMGTT